MFSRLGGIAVPDVAADVVSSATAVPFISQAGARVWKTAGSGTSFNVYECDEETGTYVQCYDSSGSAISIDLSSGGSVFVSADLFPARYIKFVGGTAATLTVVLKP